MDRTGYLVYGRFFNWAFEKGKAKGEFEVVLMEEVWQLDKWRYCCDHSSFTCFILFFCSHPSDLCWFTSNLTSVFTGLTLLFFNARFSVLLCATPDYIQLCFYPPLLETNFSKLQCWLKASLSFHQFLYAMLMSTVFFYHLLFIYLIMFNLCNSKFCSLYLYFCMKHCRILDEVKVSCHSSSSKSFLVLLSFGWCWFVHLTHILFLVWVIFFAFPMDVGTLYGELNKWRNRERRCGTYLRKMWRLPWSVGRQEKEIEKSKKVVIPFCFWKVLYWLSTFPGFPFAYMGDYFQKQICGACGFSLPN